MSYDVCHTRCHAQVMDDDGTISHKTDIFALGCVIFEMLALQAPHVDKLNCDYGDDDDEEEEDEFDDSEYQVGEL
jgi:serine/threonine protein kinase